MLSLILVRVGEVVQEFHCVHWGRGLLRVGWLLLLCLCLVWGLALELLRLDGSHVGLLLALIASLILNLRVAVVTVAGVVVAASTAPTSSAPATVVPLVSVVVVSVPVGAIVAILVSGIDCHDGVIFVGPVEMLCKRISFDSGHLGE